MFAYGYDKDGYYTHLEIVFLCPITKEPLLSANTTLVETPDVKAKDTRRWNGKSWDVVPCPKWATAEAEKAEYLKKEADEKESVKKADEILKQMKAFQAQNEKDRAQSAVAYDAPTGKILGFGSVFAYKAAKLPYLLVDQEPSRLAWGEYAYKVKGDSLILLPASEYSRDLVKAHYDAEALKVLTSVEVVSALLSLVTEKFPEVTRHLEIVKQEKAKVLSEIKT